MIMTTDTKDVCLPKPGTIPEKGTDRPTLRYLYRHVKADITNKWYEIGVELFDDGDVTILNTVKDNYPKDADKCTVEMLSLWLARKPKASWDQLLAALKESHIKLDYLASKVNAMLLKEDSNSMRQGISHDRKRTQKDDATSDPEQPSSSTAKKLNTKDGSDDDCSFKDIDFRTIDKVSNAFSKLFSTFQKATDALSDKEFKRIKNACVTRTDQADERLCSSLRRASNSEHLFEALAPYCNWMCIEYLETIAYAYKNDSLLNLIKNYSQVIFSKPLREVWNYVPFYSVKDKYYTELTAIFEDKDPDNLTVEELNRRKPQLAKEIAMLITVVRIQSLLISWLIPTSKVYQTYLSFLTVPQQLRNDSLVKFGNWMAYLPQFILQEQQKKFGMLSTSTLLIGYYHGLLLRDTNADSLIGDLYSTGLLTAQGLNVILSSHSSHYRNWLLLEYVRHMDSQAVLAFSELVKDVWPRIGIQLIATLTSAGDDFDNIIQKENNITFIFGFNFSYIEPSSVLTRYFQVSDSVVQLLSTWPVEMLLDVCENLMASGKSDVKLFSDNQMKKLKNCNSSLLLLERLSLFFTWSNHSILRVLADHCSEAVNILDDFDCRVDSFELIASYPIPCFSLSMIPFDSSSHTIVAIRCDQELYECSLQYVYDMQSVMMDKCGITQHCLQLLAVRSDPTILYWTIPKCVVCFINDNVPLNSEYLYSRGILEVLVYPDLVFTFDDHFTIGLLAFRDDSKLVERKAQLNKELHSRELQETAQSNGRLNAQLQETAKEKDQLKEENMKLISEGKEIEEKNVMKEKFEDISAELQVQKVLTSKYPLIYKKMTDITLENDQLKKQNEQLKLQLQQAQVNKVNKELHLEFQETKQNVHLNTQLQETKNQLKEQDVKLIPKLEEIKEKNPENSNPMDVVSTVSSYPPAPAKQWHQSTDTEGSDDTSCSHYSSGVCVSQISDESGKETLARSDEIIKEKQHTIYCVLHGIESSVGKYYDSIGECKRFYDKVFADNFEQFLTETASSSDFSNKLSLYLRYIEDHLKIKKCLSFCSRLWKFCAVNTVCSVFQYADEGLLICSKLRKKEIGTICKDYIMNWKGITRFTKLIGEGGFGKVYQYEQPGTGEQLAIKVEEKHPLTKCSDELFQKIINLDHPNVIKMKEYLTGPVKDKKRLCLFVMPLMNQRDLNKQFETCKCILDYMYRYPDIQKFIFRNYLAMFCQVFEGLQYLKTQQIVHRDIKPSNILVHQKCKCPSAVQCICPEIQTEYVVGDLDLLCFEGTSSAMKFNDWIMTQHDPAGTIEMKPPEAFYNSGKGEPVIDHRSDIWSGSVTMMNVLVGKRAKWGPYDQIKNFLYAITSTVRTVSDDLATSRKNLNELVDKRSSLPDEWKLSEAIGNMSADFKALKETLDKSNNSLRKMQSFQGGVPEVYKEESPLAGILSAVYVANSLHWVCLSKLPNVYDTPLWSCMIKTLDCIAEGVKFFQGNRQDAGKFVEILKPLQIEVMK